MDIILEDNWVEIMNYLNFDLHYLALTCKSLYELFLKYKPQLCNIGHYRLSPFQHQMIQDINQYTLGNDLLLINPYHIGNKLAILYSSLNYHGTTIIFTESYKFPKWNSLIQSLKLETIQILAKDYCDQRTIKFIKRHQYDPSCLDLKILIMPICITTLYNISHSKVIIHNSVNVIKRCITITRQLNPMIINNAKHKTIYYHNDINPNIHSHIHYCHRNESVGDIYLDTIVVDDRALVERLNDIYDLFTNHTYLLIKEDEDPIPNNPSIKHIMTYNELFRRYEDYLIDKSYIIFLWPGHQDINKMNDIYHHLNNIAKHNIYIEHIYSTPEEKYLRNITKITDCEFKLLKTPRLKLDYLTLIRELLLKYGDKLDKLPNYYFNLLMYVHKKEINVILEMIDRYID